MTTIEGAIIALLLADPGVSALVGTRVRPFGNPQSVQRPNVTYQRTGTRRSVSIGGFTNDGPTGLAVVTLQFDCWSDSLLTAKQVGAAIRKALNGYSGSYEGIQVNCVQIDDEREVPAALLEGQSKPVQRYVVMARVSFTDI